MGHADNGIRAWHHNSRINPQFDMLREVRHLTVFPARQPLPQLFGPSRRFGRGNSCVIEAQFLAHRKDVVGTLMGVHGNRDTVVRGMCVGVARSEREDSQRSKDIGLTFLASVPYALHAMPYRLEPLIREIPDFPKPGVMFKDITPLLADSAGLALAVELMASPFRKQKVDLVVGAESRGFIFGTAIAQALSCGFVPVRKPGKLPSKRLSRTYDLEYGQDTLEIHADAIHTHHRVLMVDDLLATGGTMLACCELVRELGAEIVGISVLIELEFLNGRRRLAPNDVTAVLRY